MLRRPALWLALLLCGMPAYAQTIHPPINQPVFRAFDANGKPLAGGMLYTYQAGTSTPLATYADAGAVTPNTNPVVLDSTGQAKIFLGAANYKFVLTDVNGVQQWTVDNISGSPSAAGVSSVFGRTGAVVAVTGDYTCSQITGAVCSAPTIYYQNIMAGGTTVSPQRNTVNLISGTGMTVSCADNSTTNRTDCTFNATTGASTPKTCNSNGCYRIESDGTIDEWGTVSVPPNGTPFNTASITFPYSFTASAVVVGNTVGQASFSGDPNMPPCVQIQSQSLSGATFFMARCIVASAGGGNFDSALTLNWHAKGN